MSLGKRQVTCQNLWWWRVWNSDKCAQDLGPGAQGEGPMLRRRKGFESFLRITPETKPLKLNKNTFIR